MRRVGTRKEACRHAHEDTCEMREYWLGEGSMKGSMTMTVCGHWFSICEDDPERYVPERWRFNMPDDRPTCPRCIERNPYSYQDMVLWVDRKGTLLQVRVDDETWVRVDGGEAVDPKECRIIQRADLPAVD